MWKLRKGLIEIYTQLTEGQRANQTKARADAIYSAFFQESTIFRLVNPAPFSYNGKFTLEAFRLTQNLSNLNLKNFFFERLMRNLRNLNLKNPIPFKFILRGFRINLSKISHVKMLTT